MKDETRNKKYNMMIEMKKQENKKTIEEKANPKCNKCYGTGNLGWNNTYKYWVVCKCVLKKAEAEQLEKKITEEKEKTE